MHGQQNDKTMQSSHIIAYLFKLPGVLKMAKTDAVSSSIMSANN